jgi:acyl-coenzyme A thioesterase PaaI-like protein
MSERVSIQESLYPELTCWGCGHANPKGFHLRSYVDGDRIVGEFTSRPEHDNGFGFLNGGIISAVLDCHGAAVVMWEAEQRGWHAAEGAPVPFITAGFDVRFLRPTPLAATVQLIGRPVSIDEREIDRAHRNHRRRQDPRRDDRELETLPPALTAVCAVMGSARPITAQTLRYEQPLVLPQLGQA